MRILSSARFYLTGDLSLEDNSYIGEHTVICGGGAKITIERNAAVGPRCTLVTGTHHFDHDRQLAAGSCLSKPITIGVNSWIGASATILGGVSIGKSVTVGAGSLVNKSVPDFSRIGGVPAKPL